MTQPDRRFAVHESSHRELPDIEAIYALAFPDEDLVPLLRALWQDPATALSLVAADADAVLGHAMFTRCALQPDTADIALLGPVAVRPDAHGRGIGSGLIREGIHRLTGEGMAAICVLGDPAYYRRFGFEPSLAIEPPYSPAEPPEEWAGAWQSLALGGAPAGPRGRLRVPAAWDREDLWLP